MGVLADIDGENLWKNVNILSLPVRAWSEVLRPCLSTLTVLEPLRRRRRRLEALFGLFIAIAKSEIHRIFSQLPSHSVCLLNACHYLHTWKPRSFLPSFLPLRPRSKRNHLQISPQAPPNAMCLTAPLTEASP